jgi:hypothetical protein
MNAALAKPIPRVLVYSTQGLDRDSNTYCVVTYYYVDWSRNHRPIDIESHDCCVAQ